MIEIEHDPHRHDDVIMLRTTLCWDGNSYSAHAERRATDYRASQRNDDGLSETTMTEGTGRHDQTAKSAYRIYFNDRRKNSSRHSTDARMVQGQFILPARSQGKQDRRIIDDQSHRSFASTTKFDGMVSEAAGVTVRSGSTVHERRNHKDATDDLCDTVHTRDVFTYLVADR